ncbi:MAG TPA: hypothetical protein VHJ20_05040 [Polyangia bacterium]|nr:hypothetical protein [Polyangia bacterium]
MSLRNDRAVIHSFETGRGRKLAFIGIALLALALVAWSLARGFRVGHVDSGARALVKQSQPAY